MGKINIYISQYVLKKLPSEAKRARSALSLYCLILHSETHALAKLIIDIDIPNIILNSIARACN